MPADDIIDHDSRDLFSSDADEHNADTAIISSLSAAAPNGGVHTGRAAAPWQHTPKGIETIALISRLSSLPVSDEDIVLLADHVCNKLRLNTEAFMKLIRGAVASAASSKRNAVEEIKNFINGPELSRPCLYALLLGNLELP